jgi:hypothetical protein
MCPGRPQGYHSTLFPFTGSTGRKIFGVGGWGIRSTVTARSTRICVPSAASPACSLMCSAVSSTLENGLKPHATCHMPHRSHRSTSALGMRDSMCMVRTPCCCFYFSDVVGFRMQAPSCLIFHVATQ